MFTSTSLEVKLVRNLSFPVSFEIVGWNITHNFVYFSDLEQLAASFLATDILLSWKSLLFKQLLNLKSADKKRKLVAIFGKILLISLI